MIKPNHTEAANGLSPAEVLEMLCSNLSNGIHAAAQPLAILCAGLGEECIQDLSENELRELAANCSHEAARLSGVFDAIRQLVVAESSSPQVASEVVNPLFEGSAQNSKRLFREAGVQLHMIPPTDFAEVLVHRGRTLKALSDVLCAALSVSSAGDTVELAGICDLNTVEVEIRNLGSTTKTLDAEFSLRMAAAEATLRRQHGGLTWSMAPFVARIILMKAPGSAQGSLR